MISVIIPVYNAEKYIERCLESLLHQSFGDWEAICVDDGSKDASGEILDKIAASDSRIRVLHIENGGVSNARNMGIAAARGESVLFVDSDDFLHPQTMEICGGLMQSEGADIVAFTYNRPYRTRHTIRQFLGLKESFAPVKFTMYDPQAVEHLTTDSIFDFATEYSKPSDIDRKWAVKHCQPWRCLYRKDCIQDIKFIKGIIYEDFPWWSMVMLQVRRATIINLPLYYYYPNLQGYIHSASQSLRIESLRTAIREVKEYYLANAPEAIYAKWEKNFLAPFEAKLKKKEGAQQKSL